VAASAGHHGALIYSQVVLSIALPFPMIALVIFTRRGDIMGGFANRTVTHWTAIIGTTAILLLNCILLLQAAGIPVPGLPG
jgi:manganese transport protein